ncbi:AfsR/SARP family transcriptional regulator [Streptomyces lydicus]|uniref:AfsR/SARP family transcriptional regulator n=1 Tax=Streptomyces lydicus TaxID=47763 RepID=UPI003787C2AD
MNANKPTSVGHLVEAVWQGRPPRTAAAQIQTCVWSLRKTLVGAGAHVGLIETKPSGYTLRLDGEQIDTAVFDRLVREAKAAASYDPALAVSLYREALRIFRGPVLAEINSPVVQAAAVQWEERRLTVLEDCIEWELTVGVQGELVAELTALVGQHPLRERFCGQLMTALYGDDRRAEALAAYQTTRRALVDQLGLEPGARLRELHHNILTGELPVPATLTPAQRPPATPAQLPATTADFVGRTSEIGQAVEVLTGERRTPPTADGADGARPLRSCQFVGKCGAGKSALALQVAHRVREHYPDGQLYADLAGSQVRPADPAEVLRGFLLSLGMPDTRIPEGVPQRAALYRSALARRRVLVLLDDAAASEQIQPLLPGGPQAAVIITGRVGLTDLPGCKPFVTDILPESEAFAMFHGIVDGTRTRPEPDAVRRIVALTGRLPLALRAAGARLSARPHLSLARFADQLQDPRERVRLLAHGSLDLRARLEASVQALPGEVRALWYGLSMLPVRDFSSRTAAGLQGVSLVVAEQMLESLVDRGLLDTVEVLPRATVRYRFHELVALCAQARLRDELSEQQRATLLDRVSAVQGRPVLPTARTDAFRAVAEQSARDAAAVTGPGT